ncbi:MAG TPA: hypothetical protein VF921_01210, partial [Vicinamibacterales bacterium]
EIGGGGVWTRGYEAGSAIAATLATPSGGTFPLFVVNARVLSASGAAAHVGIYLGRRVSVEARFEYSRSMFRASLTKDFESTPDTGAGATIRSYLVGGSLLYHLREGRFVPFVSGGGGYLRQLHEANADLLTGAEVHAGGGLEYWLGTAAHRFGLRVEGAASARSRSVAFEQKRRMLPSVTAGVSYQF